MHRCLQLARLGAGNTAPNPMVGAVLVYNDVIIGEGYHEHYGQAHAEVNCINSVKEEDRQLIEKSTMYVSLEPCAHYGKTPPCADLIIKHRIPEVVIGCRDSFDQVDGKGIARLQASGLRITVGVMEQEALQLNRRFFTFHQYHRPYIIVKWAQSNPANGAYIAGANGKRVLISNEYSNRLVHQWRSEEAAIMVGTKTALLDDPALTTRLYPGKNPVRIVIDKKLQLPGNVQLLNTAATTIVFNSTKEAMQANIIFKKIKDGAAFLSSMLHALYELQVQSVIVEGGATLLQSFINENMWDEARVITNHSLTIEEGIAAPVLHHAQQLHSTTILTDTIAFYTNTHL
ncbi:MAG: bifunctional diaminohydroxyphosphoribosylaminopyrimidine deaminase/5-amino-6-(5-phosphoribosylamino)uracil reductase RibD [Bacteroidetes bacterium]|nr:bifunctional diaminohydroxyphosphoribosylaminopyrimidine deaminase/5-amino-6-(5-phosphoribosylamino)uracil reductase RibD [Bacteroidota bacterium]